MGLIRKTLSVGTLGVVKGSSKKQRTSKATLDELRRQTGILDGSAEREAEAKRAKRLRRAVESGDGVIPLGMAKPYSGSAPADMREDIERQESERQRFERERRP